MMERPAGRPKPIRYRNPSVEDEHTDGMDWAPVTASAMNTADATSSPRDPMFVTFRRADSGLTAEQPRSRPTFPIALGQLTNLRKASFRTGLGRSIANITGANLHRRDTAQSAQYTETGSQNQSQDTQIAEARTSQQPSVSAGPARRCRARSQSNRSSGAAQAMSSPESAFESFRADSSARRLDQRLPRYGNVQPESAISRHSWSNEAANQLSRMPPPMVALPADNSSQSVSSSNRRQAVIPHDHDLLPRSHVDLSPATHHPEIFPYTAAELSNSDEDPEEMYSRYRKRRRGIESSHIVPTAETQQLEQQREFTLINSSPVSMCREEFDRSFTQKLC